jgi:hypothetical protein
MIITAISNNSNNSNNNNNNKQATSTCGSGGSGSGIFTTAQPRHGKKRRYTGGRSHEREGKSPDTGGRRRRTCRQQRAPEVDILGEGGGAGAQELEGGGGSKHCDGRMGWGRRHGGGGERHHRAQREGESAAADQALQAMEGGTVSNQRRGRFENMRAGQKRARKDVDVDRWERGAGRARRSWREGGVRSIATGGWVGDGGMGLEGRGTRGNCPHLPEMRRSWKRTCVGSDGVWWRGRE